MTHGSVDESFDGWMCVICSGLNIIIHRCIMYECEWDHGCHRANFSKLDGAVKRFFLYSSLLFSRVRVKSTVPLQ